MISDLADAVAALKAFAEVLEAIRVRSALNGLPAVGSEEERDQVNWSQALSWSSALIAGGRAAHQEPALAIAQGCLIDPESTVEERETAVMLLERMGNRPAVGLAERRDLVGEEAWTRSPLPIAVDVVRRRLELTVEIADGASIPVNPFQLDFWEAASDARWVSVSAPTSAGKSFIVRTWLTEQFGEHDAVKAVYLVPTRALIEEVSTELFAAFDESVAIQTLPWAPEIGTANHEIFVFTQERLHLLQQEMSDFAPDLIFVDEAQKFDDDSRGVLLQRVILEAVTRAPELQIIFASAFSEGPGVLLEAAPEGAKAAVVESDAVTVNQNLIWANQVSGNTKRWKIDLIRGEETQPLGFAELSNRPYPASKRLPFIAVALGGQVGNVVYVNGAAAAETASLQIYEALGERCQVEGNDRIVALKELVEKTIHPDYVLRHVLDRGIAFHYGNMPLLVRAEIEQLFKAGVVRYLVCTSTLLEGVNLPCANIFASGPKRGSKPMTPGDFWNLAGRAGRWGKEFQGNIVCVDTAVHGKWEEPPRARTRQPIARVSDKVLASSADELIEYIEAEIPPRLEKGALPLESVFSFLAHYLREDRSLTTLPGTDDLSGADLERIEKAVRDANEAVQVPGEIVDRHPGINPRAMQRLLGRFRVKEDHTDLLLPQPESPDAANLYVKALGRCGNEMHAPDFRYAPRNWMLAMLITNWMRGHPLSRLIGERVEYAKSKGLEQKLATTIRNTMDDVEQIARFEAPKYLSCYGDILEFHLGEIGESEAIAEMPDINKMLELGVSRESEISMLELGLSRASAVFLARILTEDDLTPAQALKWLGDLDHAALDTPVILREDLERVLARHRDEPEAETSG